MIGSTFIYQPDVERLKNFDMDELDEMNKHDMELLTTLDFTIIAGDAEVSWNEGEPVVLREEEGLSILKVSKAGLEAVLSFKGELDDFTKEEVQAELERLQEFIDGVGFDHIYELATF
ncbi:MAG: hypothetical protein U0V74_10365 [Chitinophagales bacterium]